MDNPAPPQETPPELMTRKEVAAYLRVEPRTVLNYVKSGALTTKKINKRTFRYFRSEVEKLGN